VLTNLIAEPLERRPWLVPAAWIVMSLIWAAVILATSQVSWPVIGWTLTTFVPLSLLKSHLGRTGRR
jgi:hypothetical protein